MAFAPSSGSTIRYRMNGEGYRKVFPEHVAALRNAGCEVVMDSTVSAGPVPKPAESRSPSVATASWARLPPKLN